MSKFLVGIIFLFISCNSVLIGDKPVAKEVLENKNLDLVKNKAKKLIKEGFSAGDGYAEIWIRDFNTFMELALDVNDNKTIREKLLVFFDFQGKDGNIVDAYVPKQSMMANAYDYIFSETQPQFAAHKNTVETDQESSLIQALYKYVEKTGEKDLLDIEVAGIEISRRLEMALEFLFKNRFNKKYGLIYGATTADWGDVQPETEWGVFVDENTHFAIDIYDNAMLVIALGNYIEMIPEASEKWTPVLELLQLNIRKHLWDVEANKFHPHIYIDSSPFPEDFNEDAIFYHGGTAVAIEAGLLSKEEIELSLNRMVENVKTIGGATIGLTMYPAYPEGFFKNPILTVPYTYQNGGDWTWFGGRMIQQLVENGFEKEAYKYLLPFIDRVIENDGFYEWYSIQNQPMGSSSYRGSAGVLYKAILELEEWARSVNQ